MGYTALFATVHGADQTYVKSKIGAVGKRRVEHVSSIVGVIDQVKALEKDPMPM